MAKRKTKQLSRTERAIRDREQRTRDSREPKAEPKDEA